MIRPQAVVLPILRAALPGVSVVSQLPDVDHRTLPMIHLRRAGGTRNPTHPTGHAIPELEMTAVSPDGLVEAEELYDAALDALYAAVRSQTIVEGVGHLRSLVEAQGATQSFSPASDSWAVAGRLTIRLRSARWSTRP